MNYLNRNFIGENNEPNIMRLNLVDHSEKVSCIELGKNFDILAVGKMRGKIKVFYFSQDEDEPTTIQRSQEEDPSKQNKNAPVVTISEQEALKNSFRNPESTVKTCSLIGHSGPITCMSINYNSSYLISASTDTDIRLWDLTLGMCISVYKSHLRTIWTIDFCPLGTHFASGGSENMIFIWSTQTPTPIHSLIGHNEEILQTKFTANRRYIGSISNDRTFRLWDLDQGELKRIFVLPESPSCFEFDLNGEFVIIGTIMGNVFVYNVLTAK